MLLAVKRDFAKQYNLQSIGDLRKVQRSTNQDLLWNLKIEMMVIKH